MVVSGPYGLVGPAGMDPAVTKTLHDALHSAMADPAHMAVLERFDMSVDYKNSADYAAFLRQVVPQEQALIRRLGLVP
jgi:tripartite-type tricarboxylate transporter receptor subunit TctC